MRALSICLLALVMGGCSLPYLSPEPSPKSHAQPTHAMPILMLVRIYTQPEDLADKPFRDLGKVSGTSCQVTHQDLPPDIPMARQRMQINASRMNADAVLLHSCEIIYDVPGCYRQALCMGSALKVNAL